MSIPTPERIATGFGLLEGPVWDPRRGLLAADATHGGVFRFDGDGVRTEIPHRRGIGGLALHADGSLIVSGRNLACKPADGGPTVVLIDNDPARTGLAGFSDLTSTPDGGIYAGLLGSRPDAHGRVAKPGGLYRIRPDGSAEALLPPPAVLHTNGLGFSPDARWLYYADSGHATVFRYRVLDDGRLGAGTPFAVLASGIPDGLAVAADGTVWIAAAFAGEVQAFRPDGRLRARIALPESLVTNVCFGGPELKTLWITTGGLDGEARIGAVYAVDLPDPGAPVPPATFPMPATPSRVLFPDGEAAAGPDR